MWTDRSAERLDRFVALLLKPGSRRGSERRRVVPVPASLSVDSDITKDAS